MGSLNFTARLKTVLSHLSEKGSGCVFSFFLTFQVNLDQSYPKRFKELFVGKRTGVVNLDELVV